MKAVSDVKLGKIVQRLLGNFPTATYTVNSEEELHDCISQVFETMQPGAERTVEIDATSSDMPIGRCVAQIRRSIPLGPTGAGERCYVTLFGLSTYMLYGNRYYTGGEWTKLYFSELAPLTPSEYVTEQGTTEDGWTYRKWSSGFSECWYHYNETIDVTINKHGVYYSDTYNLVHPVTFSQTPNVVVSGGATSQMNWAREFGSNSNFAKFVVCANEEQRCTTVDVYIYVAGK